MSKKYKENDLKEAAVFTAGGVVAAGAGVVAKIGSIGLAVAGTTVFIGAATFIAAGAVAGLTAYGFKSILIKV